MQNKPAQSAFTQSIAKEDIYAGFFTRLAACLIDSLFLFACLALPRFMFWIIGLSSPDNFLTREVLFSFSIWNILEYLLCKGYFIILTYMSGMTLGKKAMRIKVIAKDGEKPSLFTVIYRETIGKYLSAIILYCGYLLIGIDREKRGLHDMLCDTRVVYSCKVVEYKQLHTVYTPVQPFVPNMPQGGQPMQPHPFYQTVPQNRPPIQPMNGNTVPPADGNPFPPVNPAKTPAAPRSDQPETDVSKDNEADTHKMPEDIM